MGHSDAYPSPAGPNPNPNDLVPRPAPLGLLVVAAGLLVAVGWAALDPGGPLRRLKLSDRVAKAWTYRAEEFFPFAIAGAGGLALLAAAGIDATRIRQWAAAREYDQPWGLPAYDWCRSRLPDRYGPEYLKEELARGRAVLADRLARRWGRYYAAGFALILAAFLTGLYFLKSPPRGADPAAVQFVAFRPLLVASAVAGAVLLVVVVAAQAGLHALNVWQVRMEGRAVDEFRNPDGRPPASGQTPVGTHPLSGDGEAADETGGDGGSGDDYLHGNDGGPSEDPPPNGGLII